MNDKIKFIINLFMLVVLITVYTCGIAQAYSINIMFPPVVVSDEAEYKDSNADKKEIRFMLVDLVKNLFE